MRIFFKILLLVLTAACCMFTACTSDNSPEKGYMITFEANGGVGGPPPQEAAYKASLPDISSYSKPTRDEFYFSGYFDSPENGEPYYTENLTPIKDFWDKEKDTTLYAQWTLIPMVMIIFNGKEERAV